MDQLILPHPHWEAVTPATQEAFAKVSNLACIQRYYLAGGTGLALHFGHRVSVDLDLFSDQAGAVGPDERASMREMLDDPTLSITYDQDATFGATWHGVGVSFFRLNLYPLVQPTFLVDGIHLAGIEEIGAMKLAAVMGRGTRKDFIDLYFILQQIPLEAVFEVASIKYARVNSFVVGATRALAYFEDAEAYPMPGMLRQVSWIKIKKFLNEKALEAGRKHFDDLWNSGR